MTIMMALALVVLFTMMPPTVVVAVAMVATQQGSKDVLKLHSLLLFKVL